MGLSVHVWVDSYGNRREFRYRFCDVVDELEFSEGLYVEAVDALLQSIAYFLGCFSYARKGAALRISAGLDYAKQFSPRHDIKSASQVSKQPENGEVRVGFDGKGDVMVEIAKSLVKSLVIVPERLRRVDVKGSSIILGESLKVDFLAVESSLMVFELVH